MSKSLPASLFQREGEKEARLPAIPKLLRGKIIPTIIMMMKDMAKSFETAIKDRVASPLAGAFAISWCLWNYPIIVHLLVGSENASDRLAHIHNLEYLNVNFPGVLYHLVGMPLLLAIGWIYVYPILAKGPLEYSAKKRVELQNIVKGLEEKLLRTQKEWDDQKKEKDELVLENAKLRGEYAALVKTAEQGANDAIEALQEQVLLLNDELKKNSQDKAYKESLIKALQGTINQLAPYKAAIEKQAEDAATRAGDEAKGRAIERGVQRR